VDLVNEVDFTDYKEMSGVKVATHIQQYRQGNLFADIEVLNANFNTGLALSQFAIEPVESGR
jgi:hypothetical protein